MKPLKTAVTLALATALYACGSDDPASLIASAKQYMAKRDFNASVIQLKNALQKTPDNGEARYLLGLASLEQGDVVGAQIELDKAVDLGFASDEVQVALARAALARGEADKVIERFATKKLSSPKAQAELTAQLGMARLARRQAKEAERTFSEALELDSSNATANLGLARQAAVKQDFTEALARVERSLAGSGANIDALLLKGSLLAAQTKPGDAENAYRAAISAAPHEAAPRLALITHLLRQRAIERAAEEAAALGKAAPKNPVSFYARALVMIEEKKYAEAKETILQVLKVAPEHVPSLTLAGMAALNTGSLAEAESHLRKASSVAPQLTTAKRLLAATHLRMGRSDLALTEAKELLSATRGEDPGIHALAAEAYLANGDVPGAERHYERAKTLAPSSTQVQTRLAHVRFAAGDTGRGIAELESASAADPQSHQADLALITTHLRQKQPDKALEAIKALEKKQPGNPMTHNLRGVALILKGERPAARKSFERALQLRPTYLPAVANLAQLDLREKKPAAARQRYEALLKLEPNNEQAILGLAALLRIGGAEPQEIEKLLHRSVAANPSSPSARASLINFHLRNRNTKAALAAAQEARAALPSHAGLLQLLGRTQLAAGDTYQAIGSFSRLAELMPKAVEPRILLARAHMVAKQPEEAMKSLRAALDLDPDLAVVQREVVAVYLATGRPDEALRQARAAQAESPEQPHGHVLEGEVHFAQKKFDLAERKYRETLKQFDLPQIAVRLHAAMEAGGKRSQADALAKEWIQRHPKDATLLAYLGARDIDGKRYESAATRYEAALERQPDNALFLNNYAWLAHELKRPKALEYAERAHELAPQSPAIMDTLATILAASGQNDRALELFARASELAPEAHAIRLNFAKALIKASRKSAARKELESLAKLDSRQPVQQEAARLLGGL